MAKTKTQHIGRCGELLVQYRLLRLGIDSAPMTVDAGIDLVAYTPRTATPYTIQVKTNLSPKPGGGKGKPALDWWLPENSPAQLVACVDLQSETVWLFTHEEFAQLAQQRSGGELHLYCYTEPGKWPRRPGNAIADFDAYRLERRIEDLFGLATSAPLHAGADVESAL